MGAQRERGVVDAWGEVFGHPGLFVADGAVMPGPVGANPSFTIAALADRFAERAIENHRRHRLRTRRPAEAKEAAHEA
jgi:cholesterol oxidase